MSSDMANHGNNSKDNKKAASSYTKKQRLLAAMALLLIGIIIVALIINTFFGRDPGVTMALLFLLIVVPCALYGIRIFIERTTKRK